MGSRPSVPVSFLLEVKDYLQELEQQESNLDAQQETEGFDAKRDVRVGALREEIEATEEFIDSLQLW